MDLGVRGRVAIVCAASKGLGKATAASLAREGAHVVLASRDAASLDSAAREVRAGAADPSVRVLPVSTDLSRPEQIRALVARTMQEFGRVDILVTNAGGPPVATFPDLDDETWERGIELTLMSVIRCIREVLPIMRQQHWGRIVNITSISARQPINDLIVSSTLRPGILGLAKVLANQCAGDGILVNNVTPGYILPDRQKEIGPARAAGKGIAYEQYMRDLVRDVPAGRLGTPEEFADVVAFLCSERAGYVNGATLSVDGGMAKGLF
jgi:3-oxoacyl-[acyl-carrier protein] reductase